MKNIILFLSICVMLFSCQKEIIYPTDQLPSNTPTIDSSSGLSSWGKFLITDAVMYVTNSETGVKTVYEHFGLNKDSSSLILGGSSIEIETIVKNQTTYSFWKPINFPGNGKFKLNSDSTKFYEVNYIGSYRTIIEDATHNQSNLGGSSKSYNISIVDLQTKTVKIEIGENNGSISGYNCSYFTVLTLVKIEEW